MASIITFDGARSALGDEWSDEAVSPVRARLGDMAYAFISWGVVAFAAGTAVYRGLDAVRNSVKPMFSGASRRRRRQ